MSEPLRIAMVGVGRIGQVHARNLLRLAKQHGSCDVVALVDCDRERLQRFVEATGFTGSIFTSVEALADAGLCKASFVATPTAKHREHATTLIRAGHRVLLEKPLTGTVNGDRQFAAELDREHPAALMLAFQRRFDQALQYARELMQAGAVGRVFKIYSALEDSNPAPNGYQSDGILPDMSIHNVDEILWLTGRMPDRVLGIGSRIYSFRLTTCQEDFDDAVLYMWFGDDLIAQVQVSRNHVSGYRVEMILFGEEGQIQIGRFSQHPTEIVVETFGRRLGSAKRTSRTFAGGVDAADIPEFVPRFDAAYQAEAAAFIECCRTGSAFPVTHRDGLRSQEVIAAGMQKLLTVADGARVGVAT